MEAKIEIEVSNVTKEIKGIKVLDRVNLSMVGGHVYGLRGKNGAGKTMFMRCLCGLIYPTDGTIRINGEALGRDIGFPRSVGVLIENPAFLDGYTGIENLRMLAMLKGIIGEEEIRKALLAVGLDPDDKRKYKRYSLGMRQRLGIACAIMENPDLVILDEPINAYPSRILYQSSRQELQ